MTSAAGLDAIDRLPKVELHCHVEGTVRATTVLELARKAGHPLPGDDPTALYHYDSLDSFLAIFWLVQETLVEPTDWARIAYESLVDGAAHGLRYREMFFSPARHLAAGQVLGEADILHQAQREGCTTRADHRQFDPCHSDRSFCVRCSVMAASAPRRDRLTAANQDE
jgi:adenosine deaminase